ncbi:hypothetical protein [Rhodococcoides fascians]|uniref:hypothetical protein n=1 Tax=Rhodococcoides fascians TaxID=1828 RepID=UPI00050C8D83|nr:hypothetical protein [Rhodococcus fascians]
MASPATIELIGVDGSRWTLSGPGQGLEGVELATNPIGIYDAPVTTIWNATAFQIGASPGGYRTNKRDIVFAVNVWATESLEWEDVDSAWRKAWAYDRDSTLVITTEYGARSLKLRMSEQPDFKPKNDPHLKQWAVITMTCAAGNPYWYEKDVTDSWTSTLDTRGIDPATGVTRIDRGFVTVSNPTDLPIWLKWVLKAPGRWMVPDFSWKDDDWAERKILMPSQLPQEDVVINSDPMEDQAVSLNGSQFWARMNGVSFLFPVPPYTKKTQIPVSVSGAYAGTGIQVRCPRPWSRPWGLR